MNYEQRLTNHPPLDSILHKDNTTTWTMNNALQTTHVLDSILHKDNTTTWTMKNALQTTRR